MLVMKQCPVCGKAFEKTGNRQIFCSKACAHKRHAAQQLARDRAAREARAVRAKCLTCGKEFVKKNSTQKCCCIRCKRKHDHVILKEKRAANPKMRTCVVCGKEFVVASGAHVVCSKECRRIHQNDLSRQRKATHAEHRFYKCHGCGKVFQVVGAWYRYCPKCRENGRGSAGRGGTARTGVGLTEEQMRAVAYAQDRLPAEKLYEASLKWTPKQRKYAIARYEKKYMPPMRFRFN